MSAGVKRRTLSRERVAAAALELIEREGLARLTMRRLGGRLGVEGMALYTHVRNKDDLLNAVADLILDQLEVSFDGERSWAERMRSGALAWASLQERYPQAFPLVFRGGLQTDKLWLLTEDLLDALRDAGFDERGAAEAYQAFVVLLDSALIGRSSWDDAALQAAWQKGAAAVDASRYPRYAEIAPHAATLRWPVVLDVALDLLLRGLEERVRCFGHDPPADDCG
jgi:AcrR family transcriptional regulator